MTESEQRITGITPHPRRADRFLVERDGAPWVQLSAARVAELGLRVGERLTGERAEAIERAAAVDAAMDVALRALAVRPRSEAELAQRLRQKGVAAEVARDVLARLRALGYLDDQAFAEAWVAQRQRLNPRGTAALRRELQAKGIAPEIIEAVVGTGEDDLAAARSVARKHWPRLQRLERTVAERRLLGLLQRRGFSWPTIRRVMAELTGSDPRLE